VFCTAKDKTSLSISEVIEEFASSVWLPCG
jgi:hypothetical protein